MKRIFVTSLLIFMIGAIASAQPTVSPVKETENTAPTQYLYCEIVGAFSGTIYGSKGSIVIDYGQETSIIPSHWLEETKDANGKELKFKYMVDALNFMTSLGWEFVQAYAVTNNVNYNCYHYLMRRAKE